MLAQQLQLAARVKPIFARVPTNAEKNELHMRGIAPGLRIACEETLTVANASTSLRRQHALRLDDGEDLIDVDMFQDLHTPIPPNDFNSVDAQ